MHTESVKNNAYTDINIQTLEVETNSKTNAVLVFLSLFVLGVGHCRTTVSTLSSPNVHTWQDARALLLMVAWITLAVQQYTYITRKYI